MSSRMTKYYEETDTSSSRFERNESLYKDIGKSDLSSFDIKSNAVVLGDNKNDIDVEKIKKILDTKYNNIPQRKSIRIEEEAEVPEEKETTKEYDINVILEKAREQKSDNYEEERFKKLRDTQFDILKNLDLEKKEEHDDVGNDLKALINTIALNEKNVDHKNEDESSDDSPLDILSDLKGSGNTEVLDGLKEEVKKAIDSNEEDNSEEEKKLENQEVDTKLINSFYTSSNALKEKDFEDMEDFQKSIESGNSFVKIAIIIVVIGFIVGIVLLIKAIYFS